MDNRVASHLFPLFIIAVLAHLPSTKADAVHESGFAAEPGHYTRSVVVLAGDDGSELQIDTCLQEELAKLLGDATLRRPLPSAARVEEPPEVPVLVIPFDVGGVVDAGCYGDDCDMDCDEYPGPTVRVHEALQVRCDGFQPPMDRFPVTSSGIGAYPLTMKLFDEDGLELTPLDLSVPPVVQVAFRPGRGGHAVDASDRLLPAGKGSEGNQFEFTDQGLWQFNLKMRNYRAPGRYIVTAVSGDDFEYALMPTCTTAFVTK